MKVLCIKNNGPWRRLATKASAFGPEYGEICTVVAELNFDDGLDTYVLAEYYNKLGHLKKHFIPLSDKDETEYAEQIMEQINFPSPITK